MYLPDREDDAPDLPDPVKFLGMHPLWWVLAVVLSIAAYNLWDHIEDEFFEDSSYYEEEADFEKSDHGEDAADKPWMQDLLKKDGEDDDAEGDQPEAPAADGAPDQIENLPWSDRAPAN